MGYRPALKTMTESIHGPPFLLSLTEGLRTSYVEIKYIQPNNFFSSLHDQFRFSFRQKPCLLVGQYAHCSWKYRSALDAANSHPLCAVDSHADVARSHAHHDSCAAPSSAALPRHYVHARYPVRFRVQKGEDSQRALRVMLRRLHRCFTQALWHQKSGDDEHITRN